LWRSDKIALISEMAVMFNVFIFFPWQNFSRQSPMIFHDGSLS